MSMLLRQSPTRRVRMAEAGAGSGGEVTLVTSYQLPVIGGTQIKFGRRVPFAHSTRNKKLYTVGGEVWQATNPSVQAGSPSMFTYDPATGTLAQVADYFMASGVQPQYPDGGQLVFDPESTQVGPVLIPRTQRTTGENGAWGGGSTPVVGSIMRYQESLGTWATMYAFNSNWPSGAHYAGTGQINGTLSYAITSIAGVATLLVQELGDNVYFTYELTAGFASVNPGNTTQVYVGAEQLRCVCYDWATGRLISHPVQNGTTTVIASGLPTLTADTDPFAMSYDPRRHKILCFFGTTIKSVDVETGTITDGGTAPHAFTTACYDPTSDKHIVTGKDGGLDTVYHYVLADRNIDTVLRGESWDEDDLTTSYYQYVCKWEWRNAGGDWYDAAGVAQGATGYDVSGTLSGVGWKTLSIGTLVQWWLNNQNTGTIIISTGDTRFYSRNYTVDTSKHPYLSVTTNTGTFTCVCLADTVSAGGTPNGQSDNMQGNGVNLALRFDLSAVTGTVSSATLNMYAYSNVGGTIKAHRLRPPPIQLAGTGTPVTGIAQAYTLDSGLSAHGSVYVADHYSSGYAARLGITGTQEKSTSYDATYAEWNARYEFDGNSRTATSQRILLTNLSQTNKDELYIRTSLTLENDFDPHVDGGKLGAPSVDFRMGGNCGNGGSGSTGLREYVSGERDYTVDTTANTITVTAHGKSENTPFKFVYLTPPAPFTDGTEYFAVGVTTNTFQVAATSGGAAIDITADKSGTRPRLVFGPSYPSLQYCGGSSRMNFQRVPVGTNLSGFVVPYLYLYRAGVVGFGDPLVFGDNTNGYVVMAKGVRYDVETRILMNTIAGPLDSLGNGTGNADGVVEYWINGVKCFTWTGVLRHNAGIQAMGWWHDTTHGGTFNTQAEHHYKTGKFVMASAYIGAIKT